MDWFIEHWSINYDPPGDYSRALTGTRSGIVRAPAGLRPCSLQDESGPHSHPPGYRRGSGRVPCVLSFKMCHRFPDGSRQGPRRASAGQFTGLIRGLCLAGARVTFKLELKVTRVPRGVNKMDGTRSRSHRFPCGTAKNGPKTARELPGKAPFVNCDQGISNSWVTPEWF